MAVSTTKRPQGPLGAWSWGRKEIPWQNGLQKGGGGNSVSEEKGEEFFFCWVGGGGGGGVGMRVYIVYDKFSPTPTVLTFLLQPLENLPSSLQFFIFFMHKIYDVYYTSILHYFMHISGREVL